MENIKSKTYRIPLVILILFCIINCTEEFVPKTDIFESILVVEANITDEFKEQRILLSKTFRFEDESRTNPERNAKVKIVDNLQNEYLFKETTPGIYTSISFFQALYDREYTLLIDTDDGKSYISDSVILTPQSNIDSLYAQRIFNDKGLEGIGIFVDSFDATEETSFYRYEFEATYRFTAPEFFDLDLIITSENPLEIKFVNRSVDKKVCYKTELFNNIVITNTEGLNENRLSRFLIHFIGIDNYAISDRYSINVHQFTQSRETQEFYRVLQDFSNSTTLFSQIQPGFILGNIKAVANEKENVLGLFQASSVSTKRIFFNYRDFFPEEDLPPFFEDCTIGAPAVGPSFISLINADIFLFAGFNGDPNSGPGPYNLVEKACGDCTEIGSSTVPKFWEN